jgi:Na+-driven multidrug efflux pump
MSSLRLKTNYIHIIRFAIPISVAMIIPQINYIVNNIFLSRLGETELYCPEEQGRRISK